MRSASTQAVDSVSELSKIAQEKAIQGQPTLAARAQGMPVLSARVQARPIMASPVSEPVKAPAARIETPVYTVPAERQAPVARVMARPLMGQTPATMPAAAPQGITLSREEASLILQGLTETLQLADNARTTGWRCTGVDDATFYKGRVLRDRLAGYLAQPASSGGVFAITKEEADVADRILGCSNEATASSSNKTAWIALGVIVVGAAIFFSVTSGSK